MNIRSIFAAFTSVVVALTVSTASAAVIYSQNFDSMGTGTAAPPLTEARHHLAGDQP